jgi:hypothetical protein
MRDDLPTEGPSGVDSQPISQTRLEAADWSPLEYTGVLHFLLDGGMTGLPAPAQVLYLQLVREALGRRRNPVRMTLDQLREKTGLSRSTIHDALRLLAGPDIDIVNVVSRGGPKLPGLYQVRLCSYRKTAIGVQRTRRRVLSVPGSIECRLAALTKEDRDDLEVLYHGLPGAERKNLEAEVREKFADIGQDPDAKTFRQAVLFYLMKRDMYQRMKKNYPHWFSRTPPH